MFRALVVGNKIVGNKIASLEKRVQNYKIF